MAKGVEKRECEPDCARFLNRLGWGVKLDPEMVCQRCHKVNYPTHTGAVDYLGVLRGMNGPVVIGVEVKGVEALRFPFSKWTEEQRDWGKYWQDRLGDDTRAFVWLQIGTESVNSRFVDARRRVWLVPRAAMEVTATWLDEHYGLKSIPMNDAARSKGTDPMDWHLTAENIFKDYALEWVPKFGWWIPKNSLLWQRIGAKPSEPTSAIQFNIEHPHPDRNSGTPSDEDNLSDGEGS